MPAVISRMDTNRFKRVLTERSEEGVNGIILAFDFDAEFNPHVAKTLKNAEQLGVERGFDVYPLYWTHTSMASMI